MRSPTEYREPDSKRKGNHRPRCFDWLLLLLLVYVSTYLWTSICKQRRELAATPPHVHSQRRDLGFPFQSDPSNVEFINFVVQNLLVLASHLSCWFYGNWKCCCAYQFLTSLDSFIYWRMMRDEQGRLNYFLLQKITLCLTFVVGRSRYTHTHIPMLFVCLIFFFVYLFSQGYNSI